MEHTHIVSAADLETYADTRESESVIPELIWMLVNRVPDLTVCRIPYGDAVNQPGWDGLVETSSGFRQFVPAGKSFWEIGTGRNPQNKATKDFKNRTRIMALQDRGASAYVFVTPRSAGTGGWNEPTQSKWIDRRKRFGWGCVKVIDAVQLADWLRDFPVIGKWLLKRMGLVKSTTGFTTASEHWENLEQLARTGDPPLPPNVFLIGRDQACAELERIFRSQTKQLVLAVESEWDAEDFVSAFLASLEPEVRRAFSSRCLFVNDAETWHSMVSLRTAHILVAHPGLDLESSGEQLHMAALNSGHAVIIPVAGAWKGGAAGPILLRSPSATTLETTLTAANYKPDRAREIAQAGALSLASLKRHLRGLGNLPPYATWDSARLLAQAELFGRWAGENPADRAAIEAVVGKSYGEWIERVRPETLRPDTPLTQRNENWKVISRAEAWSALGPHLTNEDLDRFRETALAVLGERDPEFELPPDQRFVASAHGKVLQHSSSLRKGIAETLALIGSRPEALASCTQGKPEATAILTVRGLLANADWLLWVSLDDHLPMLGEAAPDEFLDAVENALLNPDKTPFKEVFAQEGPAIMGWNYMSGLLWALETLAWDADHLLRVTMILGDLANIDPGGNWTNRPANSLVSIFLPWFPQTAASISKRKASVETLLREHPAVGWKLLMSLLPQLHGITTGTRKPAWRRYVPPDWSDGGTTREYRDQVSCYADLALREAADFSKLEQLIDRLPDLPNPAHSKLLVHLASDAVVQLPEFKRTALWEALIDIVAKHRKFSDAQWALPSEAVTKIEETAAKIAPSSPSAVYRRLFSDRDFDLFDEKGDYEQQRQTLELRRQTAIAEIYGAGQLEAIFEFAKQVASPEQVGQALGRIDCEAADLELLPKYLHSTEAVELAFIKGFIWGRFWSKRWEWADALPLRDWSVDEKANLFAMLPFMGESWRRAEDALGDQALLYWNRANVNPWGPHENLEEAVEKLLQCGRPQAAVQCLYRLAGDNKKFPSSLAIRALLENIPTEKTKTVIDQHAVLKLIEWLQQNPEADQDAIFRIEWAYLPLLDHQYGGVPKILERRLASDPNFFCEIVRIVFRSDKKDASGDKEPTESERKVAQNAYRLLHGWKTVPGTSSDPGSLNADLFNAWLASVREQTTQSGHFKIAMDQLGKVLAHSPQDPGGLWIHQTVANALNQKDAAEMRSGFTCEVFNQRGVHGYTAGREEQEIAAGFHTKADALEECGYHRFATAIRELARSYERDAERQSATHPMED